MDEFTSGVFQGAGCMVGGVLMATAIRIALNAHPILKLGMLSYGVYKGVQAMNAAEVDLT